MPLRLDRRRGPGHGPRQRRRGLFSRSGWGQPELLVHRCCGGSDRRRRGPHPGHRRRPPRSEAGLGDGKHLVDDHEGVQRSRPHGRGPVPPDRRQRGVIRRGGLRPHVTEVGQAARCSRHYHQPQSGRFQ